MERYAAVLAQNALFEKVPREVLCGSILPHCQIRSYPRGTSLFLPRERVSSVHILCTGKVKLVYYLENGDEDIRNLILPPKLIGVDLICTRTQLSPYQAAAAEDSEVLSFPAGLLLTQGGLPEQHRLTCLGNLLRVISNLNMQNEYRLAILARNSLRERILVYLTMQANKAQKKHFQIPFSRDEMASFLRVNRSALSHELSLMAQEGVIAFRKNEFTLLTDSGFETDA